MDEPSELRDLNKNLDELIKKLEKPKTKDFWDKLPAITTFAATVVLAGLSLLLTQWFQRFESDRQKEFRDAQMALSRAQVRVEELKAITSLAPLLASKDESTRRVGRQLLEAVNKSSNVDAAESAVSVAGEQRKKSPAESERQATPKHSDSSKTERASSRSLIDSFAAIALSSQQPVVKRVEALTQIRTIATAPHTAPELRERAVGIAAKVATSTDTPLELREVAQDIIGRIKSISPSEVGATVQREPISRTINAIILHHAGVPSRHLQNTALVELAKRQLGTQGLPAVSWHYAISADGTIWLGMPLDKHGIHTRGHNSTSLSIMLMIDGNSEVPTEQQQVALVAVLRALAMRLQWFTEAELAKRLRFHSDADPERSGCPGQNITKELALGWVRSSLR